MPDLLLSLTALPTALFTLLMIPVMAYWLFVIVGFVDIDVLDGAGEALDGMFDGAAQALDGAADALDGALDGAGAIDGAADGALEGGGEAHGSGWLVGLTQALRLRDAPVTLVASLLITYAWSFCLLAMHFLGGLQPAWLVALAVGLGAGIFSLALTSWSVRPLARFFVVHQGARRKELIGSVCTVTTGRVSAEFGQAELADGGAGLLLQVRCDRDNALQRGSEALIVHFDDRREAFIIEPMAEPDR